MLVLYSVVVKGDLEESVEQDRTGEIFSVLEIVLYDMMPVG